MNTRIVHDVAFATALHILEVFAPPYVSSSHANAVPLYADGEAPAPKKPVRNYFVSDEYRKIEEKLPVAKAR